MILIYLRQKYPYIFDLKSLKFNPFVPGTRYDCLVAAFCGDRKAITAFSKGGFSRIELPRNPR